MTSERTPTPPMKQEELVTGGTTECENSQCMQQSRLTGVEGSLEIGEGRFRF